MSQHYQNLHWNNCVQNASVPHRPKGSATTFMANCIAFRTAKQTGEEIKYYTTGKIIAYKLGSPGSILLLKIQVVLDDVGGLDSAVGIATRYELDGSGIESPWRRDLPHSSRPARGPSHPPIQWVLGLPWGRAAGAWG